VYLTFRSLKNSILDLSGFEIHPEVGQTGTGPTVSAAQLELAR
jgi:hypothetical protein